MITSDLLRGQKSHFKCPKWMCKFRGFDNFREIGWGLFTKSCLGRLLVVFGGIHAIIWAFVIEFDHFWSI